MGFEIGDTYSRGTAKLLAPVGAIIAGGYFIISLLSSVGQQNLLEATADEVIADFRETLGDEAADFIEEAIADLPFAVGLPESVASLLVIAGFAGTFVIFTIGIASFGSEQTGVDAVTFEGLVWNTLNLFAGGIVFGIAVALGLTLFFIPGLIIFTALVFFPAAIAIDGENFIEAFGTSVTIVKDNVIPTVGIVGGWLLVMIVVSMIGGAVSVALPTMAGEIVSQAISAAGIAYFMALLATAYVINDDKQPDPVADEEFDPHAEPWE